MNVSFIERKKQNRWFFTLLWIPCLAD